ncbi:MAG: hypothetical protein HZB53_01940 [Chloroflexi bacterium]|nr:hypothetical protein [Chloroflexota bacterium]
MPDRPIDSDTGNPMSLRDISAYGASIQRASGLPPGTRYWKIVDAYHLSGRQNRGNRNLNVDVLAMDGTRRYGAKCRLVWAGRSADLTIDKPGNEPGTSTPMYAGNFYDIEALGMPSDKAVGFGTEHPDEEAGNTFGHHSFMVVFREALFEGDAAPANGSIRGTLTNGAGRSVLLAGGNVNTSAIAGADGAFAFDDVPPGAYTLTVAGTAVSASVTVVAGQTASITLTVPADIPPPDDTADLQRQIAELQAQVASLTSQLAAANDAHAKAAGVLAQIKQVIQNAGM